MPDRITHRPIITSAQFRERAREWLLRHSGYIPRDHDVKLGAEMERVYEEGRAAGRQERQEAPPEPDQNEKRY